jgi:beta-phosphoglucomutase family hydrolase
VARIPASVEAVIFDLDGVVTDTATVHRVAWKQLFDDFLRHRAAQTGEPFAEFTDADYLTYVDGKPRYDGAASFLASRGIALPYGDPSDEPGSGTLCGLANRKNDLFQKVLSDHGVTRFETSVALIVELRGRGVRTAVVSSSRNCREVVERAGLTALFDAMVDGSVADELGLPGKPDPAMFLEAARRLEVPAARTAVVEDAVSGVEAGRRGGFAPVIGVDRVGQAGELLRHGADIVVQDLGELLTSKDAT